MCSSEFNLQGTNMPLEQINKAIKQLEFLQSLPNQKGVVKKIAETLQEHFEIEIYTIPYFTQVIIKSKKYHFKIKENLHYEENYGNTHRVVALRNALLKVKDPNASKTIPITDS